MASEIVPQSDEPDLGFAGSLQGSFTSGIAVNPRGDIAPCQQHFCTGSVQPYLDVAQTRCATVIYLFTSTCHQAQQI